MELNQTQLTELAIMDIGDSIILDNSIIIQKTMITGNTNHHTCNHCILNGTADTCKIIFQDSNLTTNYLVEYDYTRPCFDLDDLCNSYFIIQK